MSVPLGVKRVRQKQQCCCSGGSTSNCNSTGLHLVDPPDREVYFFVPFFFGAGGFLYALRLPTVVFFTL